MSKHNYGVILDAGSSGTRVYVYEWKNAERARKDAKAKDLGRLPKVKTKETKKVHPGVSTFADKPESVGPEHLKALFDFALEHIPKAQVPETPIFLLATAGMRLLKDYERNLLLKEICSYARRSTQFLLPDCGLHIQVIPGETEGLYGWIAANYLMEGFDVPEDHNHGKGHHTYGFLDMGGASAQIAFAPNSTEAEKHAEDLKLLRLRTLDGKAQEYRVFTTTWLGFGANESRKRYVDALKETTTSKEIPDPCLPKGVRVDEEGKPVQKGSDAAKGKAVQLVGTGQFPECLKKTFPLLEKDVVCKNDPCLLNGIHVPAIDFDVNHFIGVSEYWHTTHEIFELDHADKAYDLVTYQKRVNDFCSQSWTQIATDLEKHKWGQKVDESTALKICFKASWLINVLHDGIGVPRVGLEGLKGSHNGTKEVLDKAKQKGYLDPFHPVNKIDGEEVSWTLGKAVLFASSQVPPTDDDALAVGFGSNSKGAIADWQNAGGTRGGGNGSASTADGEHGWLFRDSPRRIPGLLIFLAIVALAAYLLCGRDRRASLTGKLRRMAAGGSPSMASTRRRRLPLGKLFGGVAHPSGPAYDRLETGEVSDNDIDDDIELPDLGSLAGSDEGSRGGTPKLLPTAMAFSTAGALGLGGARTDSRERLPVSSRAGSPKRWSRAGSPSRSPLGMATGGKTWS